MLAQTEDEKKVEWYNLVGQFKLRANEFMRIWRSLQSQASVVARFPPLQTEYSGLNNRAGIIKSMIEKVTRTVDNIMGWFRSVFGLGGIDTLEGLGILPLLPIAVIVGALTMISKWVADVYIFNKKLAEQVRLERTGLSPTAAARVIQSTAPQGIMAMFTQNMMPILLIGGALLLFGPILLKQFKKPAD